MHRALLKLISLQFRGWMRRQFTGGSVRRLVFGVLGGMMFLLWLSSLAISAAFQQAMAPEKILAVVPLYITAFALLPIILGNDDRAIAFTPAEIDLLFAGPFRRRDLVLFKMTKLVLGSLGGGLLFGLVMRRFAASIPMCIAGAVMTLVFTNLLSTMAALLRDAIRERSYAAVRLGAAALLLAGGGAAVWYAKQSDAPLMDRLRALGESAPAQVILAPARLFAHVFAARTIGEFALWTTGCLTLIGVMVLAILALDRLYMGAAVSASQRRQDRLIRAGKGIGGLSGKSAKAVPLPDLSALGPAGAIVRRQIITALRTSRGWMVAFAIAVAYVFVVLRVTRGQKEVPAVAGLVPGFVMLVLFLPQALRFDFRGDLDHLETLKGLPITPAAAALGELVVPSLILSLLGWVIAAGAAVFTGLASGTMVMIVLAVTPVAVTLIALENFVFLIFPTRLLMPGQGGAVFSGRRLMMALARLVLVLCGGALVGTVGAIAWWVSGSVWATYLVCWLALLTIAGGMLRAVAWGFVRFDVSLDMPT